MHNLWKAAKRKWCFSRSIHTKREDNVAKDRPNVFRAYVIGIYICLLLVRIQTILAREMYRRIRLICFIIELKTRGLVDNPAHIIGFALIVENYSPLVSALRYREYWYTR